MSELKTLATCKPSEFLKQTNRIKKSVEKWLTDTDIMNIRKRVATLEMAPHDATAEEKAAVEDRNKIAVRSQALKNISAMWEAISEIHPDETLEIIALCCFIEPAEIDNYEMRDLLMAFNSLITDSAVVGFFTSLASLAQMGISGASKA